MEPLSYEGFKNLALASRRAFHLEQCDSYHVAAEDEPFGRWLRGEPDDYAWHQDWLSFLRQAAAAGVAVQRVRLASTPPTDYIRWGLDVSLLGFICLPSRPGRSATWIAPTVSFHRVDKGGKDSFGRVMRGLATLRRKGVEWNALTTVHVMGQSPTALLSAYPRGR